MVSCMVTAKLYISRSGPCRSHETHIFVIRCPVGVYVQLSVLHVYQQQWLWEYIQRFPFVLLLEFIIHVTNVHEVYVGGWNI